MAQAPAIDPNYMYSVPQTRRVLNVGHTKVYELLDVGEDDSREDEPRLKSVKIGGRRLIRGKWIIEFLDALEEAASRRVGSTSQAA